jgi:hypothetical protein
MFYILFHSDKQQFVNIYWNFLSYSIQSNLIVRVAYYLQNVKMKSSHHNINRPRVPPWDEIQSGLRPDQRAEPSMIRAPGWEPRCDQFQKKISPRSRLFQELREMDGSFPGIFSRQDFFYSTAWGLLSSIAEGFRMPEK